MARIILYIILFVCTSATLCAQELNAKITINRQKIQSPNNELFSSLETAVNRLMNEQKWTETTFNKNERIDCIIAITINEMAGENSFIAEIQITGRRPVYNSNYITSLMNHKDNSFAFNYTMGESMEFNSMNIGSNLIATMSFYAYVLIGLDFDSFSPNGGRPYFEKALEIANNAQSLNTKGWEPFSGNNNRYDLGVALTDEASKSFHTMWYNYHRLGLDEMAANPLRGRINIIATLADLQKVYDARPSSPLITFFGDTKLDELLKISSQATSEEKKEIKKVLLQLFPTKNSMINEELR